MSTDRTYSIGNCLTPMGDHPLGDGFWVPLPDTAGAGLASGSLWPHLVKIAEWVIPRNAMPWDEIGGNTLFVGFGYVLSLNTVSVRSPTFYLYIEETPHLIWLINSYRWLPIWNWSMYGRDYTNPIPIPDIGTDLTMSLFVYSRSPNVWIGPFSWHLINYAT